MPRSPIRITFPLVLWCGAAILVFYLTCWPLVENTIASRTWERIPCEISDNGKYIYEYQGIRYFASRKNFWDHEAVLATATSSDVPLQNTDAICYVKPSSPEWAVLRLDAYQHLEDGARGYMHAGIVMIVAGILSFGIHQKKRALRPAPIAGTDATPEMTSNNTVA